MNEKYFLEVFTGSVVFLLLFMPIQIICQYKIIDSSGGDFDDFLDRWFIISNDSIVLEV